MITAFFSIRDPSVFIKITYFIKGGGINTQSCGTQLRAQKYYTKTDYHNLGEI